MSGRFMIYPFLDCSLVSTSDVDELGAVSAFVAVIGVVESGTGSAFIAVVSVSSALVLMADIVTVTSFLSQPHLDNLLCELTFFSAGARSIWLAMAFS